MEIALEILKIIVAPIAVAIFLVYWFRPGEERKEAREHQEEIKSSITSLEQKVASQPELIATKTALAIEKMRNEVSKDIEVGKVVALRAAEKRVSKDTCLGHRARLEKDDEEQKASIKVLFQKADKGRL